MKQESEITKIVERKYGGPVQEITDTRPFLDGMLTTLVVKKSGGDAWKVWFWESYVSSETQDFDSTEGLLAFVSMRGRPRSGSIIERLTSVNFISAFIAILLTLAIVFLAVYRQTADIPAILANALTVILGFYFGRAGADNRPNQGAASPHH